MLYCVFYNKEIIGRFLNKDRAFNYVTDLQHKGMLNIIIKAMTKEEYENYTKILISEEKKGVK